MFKCYRLGKMTISDLIMKTILLQIRFNVEIYSI